MSGTTARPESASENRALSVRRGLPALESCARSNPTRWDAHARAAARRGSLAGEAQEGRGEVSTTGTGRTKGWARCGDGTIADGSVPQVTTGAVGCGAVQSGTVAPCTWRSVALPPYTPPRLCVGEAEEQGSAGFGAGTPRILARRDERNAKRSQKPTLSPTGTLPRNLPRNLCLPTN